MGGLSPENVHIIIRELGPPRKLAERYVTGRGKRVLRFELGIPEDLYQIFIFVALILSLMIIGGTTIDLAYQATSKTISPSLVAVKIVDMLISLVVMILALYLAFSFIGSNPEIKEYVKQVMRNITAFFFESPRKEEKQEPAVFEPKTVSAWPKLASAVFNTFLGYLIYYYLFPLNFNWLMQLLLYSILASFILAAVIDYIHYFYIKSSGARNYLLDTLSDLEALILIPWLFLANLFPEYLQIPIIRNIEEVNDFDTLINNIEIINLPT